MDKLNDFIAKLGELFQMIKTLVESILSTLDNFTGYTVEEESAVEGE